LFIKVSADGRVTLEDRDNFRAFKLVIAGDPAALDTARRALANLAELPGTDSAWVFEQALRQRPEVAQDNAWQTSLAGMIDKARPHGWIDDERQAIKAHIEWTGAA
jgi:predicted transcriptional regulator